ncbi:MAG: PQQ-binding-like beta-propeller repeat protein [Kofleriaceae bacterium]|nr:PQQ-binding-like beta-propeller repeat protein [Kofleriaceae bacterium]
MRGALLVLLASAACSRTVTVAVYRDLDGDGRRGADEPGLPGRLVAIERLSAATTDAAGVAHLLMPDAPLVAWTWPGADDQVGPVGRLLGADDGVIELGLRPAAAGRTPLRFAVGSDPHVRLPVAGERWDGGDLGAALVQLEDGPPLRFVTLLGDLTQDSEPAQFDRLAAAVAGLHAPFVPVAGNHDLHDGGAAWRQRLGPDAYGFDLADEDGAVVRVLVWNGFTDDTDQAAFLDLVLPRLPPVATTIALGHAPPRDWVIEHMATLGVDAVFTGHWHASRKQLRAGVTEWSTESLIMGGLDQTPAGFRTVTARAGQLTVDDHRQLAAPLLGLISPSARGCEHAGARGLRVVAAGGATRPRVEARLDDGPWQDVPHVAGWLHAAPLRPGPRPHQVALRSTLGARVTETTIAVPACAGPARPARPRVAGGWPQLQGGPDHRGASPHTLTPPLVEAWVAALPGPALTGGVVVADGVVLVSTPALGGRSGPGGSAPPPSPGLVAFDLTTGAPRWQLATTTPVRAAPAVADGVVVVVETGGQVHAVELATGAPRWRHDLTDDTSGWARSAWAGPTIADGVVYTGVLGRFGALDLATGRRRWSQPLAPDWPWIGTLASPALLGDDVLYVLGREYGLYQADRATGAQRRWRQDEALLGINTTPVVAGDLVVVGTTRGEVWGLAASDLSTRWRTPLMVDGHDWSAGIAAHLAVGPEVVLAATTAGELVALERGTGLVRWRRSMAGGPLTVAHYASDRVGVLASPVLTGDVVWLGHADGALVAYALADGAELGRVDLGAPILSGPAVVEGGLVVATFAGTVHLLVAPDRLPAAPAPARHRWWIAAAAVALVLLGAGVMRRTWRRRLAAPTKI